MTNPDSIDLHLRQDSVATNAGSNDADAQIKTDLDGQARRYNNGTVDVGVYVFDWAEILETTVATQQQSAPLTAATWDGNDRKKTYDWRL